METYYHQLVVKALSDHLEESEQEALESWVKSSPENEAYYDEMKALWEKVSLAEVYSDDQEKSELDGAWDRFKEKLSEEKRLEDTMALSRYHWVYQVAASLLLVAGLAYLMVQHVTSTLSEMERHTADRGDVFYLPDSSMVWLNKYSSLSYTLEGNERRVVLSGQAFFDVKRDTTSPFIIKTAGTITRVLGTSFDLNAYDTNEVHLTVVSGKVSFSAQGQSLMVLPKGKAVYNYSAQTLMLEETDSVTSAASEVVWIKEDTYNESAVYAYEKAHPERYVKQEFHWRSNLLSQSVIEGTLLSKAKLYSYDHLVIKATCTTSKHKTFTYRFTVVGQLKPGGVVSYKKRLPDWFKDTQKVDLSLEK